MTVIVEVHKFDIIYHVGGWFDGFTRGSFELLRTLEKTNPSKLVMHPGYHDVTGGPYYDYLREDKKAARDRLILEHLRFFDHYIKLQIKFHCCLILKHRLNQAEQKERLKRK